MKQIYTFISVPKWALRALTVALSMLPMLVSAQVYVNASGTCTGGTPCFLTLQAAIDDPGTVANTMINVETNLTAGMVNVNKSVRIVGPAGGVTLNSTSAYHGIYITAPDVTIRRITVDNAGTFGIVAAPGANNLRLIRVTTSNNGRLVPLNGLSGSGIALTGIDGAILTDIVSTGNKGNGVSITASQNVTINGLVTSGNSFFLGFNASVGIFSSTLYTPCSVDTVLIQGVFTAGEQILVYQEDDETDACAFPNITNVIVGTPATHFAGSCISSDGAWSRTLSDAGQQASALDITNTAYTSAQMYVRDLSNNNFYSDGAGSYFDPVNPGAALPCAPIAPVVACGADDVLPEIYFAVNSLPVGNTNNGQVDDLEELTFSVCEGDDNIYCAPFPPEITNIDSLPDGVSVGLAFDFTASNMTINNLPVVDFHSCLDDFTGLLEQFFEPSDVELINNTLPGSLQLVITPFIDSNNNCTLDDGECEGEIISITINIPSSTPACALPTIDNENGPNVADPCTCSDTPGYFDEEIVITSPGGAGQTWTVASNDGFVNPITLVPYPVGTPFIDRGNGTYTLAGSHASGVGYILTATSPSYPNTPLGINNTCFYPEPDITSDIPEQVCTNVAPIILTGTEIRTNGEQGTGTFFINGNLAPLNGNGDPFFDPAASPLGTNIITLTWDAGDPADPITGVGCVASVSDTVDVVQGSVVIAENETFTLPTCGQDVQICYSFNVTECEGIAFNVGLLDVDFGDLDDNLVPGPPRTEPAGDNTVFVEYCFLVSDKDVGISTININYGGVDVSPRIQILGNSIVRDYSNVACIGTVNIKLDDNCSATLGASEVLNGLNICDYDFCIEIVQTVNNRIVYTNRNGVIDNGCGQYIYRVYRKRANGECDFSNMTCWGYVNAEDKTAPSIECPDNAQRGRRELPVYTFAGTLGAGDDIFDPTESTCFRSTAFGGFAVLDLLGTDRFYDLQNFKVTTSGIYTLHLISRDQNPFTGNGLAALYGTGGFDEDYPCENILALGDYTFAPGPWSGLGDYLNFLGNINGWSIFLSAIYGGQGDTDPYIRTYLTAGREYTLLTSSTLGLPDGGDYRWFIYPEDESGKVTTFNGTVFELFDGNGRLINPLICTDKDLLVLPTQKCYYTDEDGNLITASGAPLSEAAFEATPLGEVLARTGYPHVGDIFGGSVSDNCGDITICVSDRLVERNGDCGEWVIIRTFTATDECSGLRDFCEQRIRVRQPTLEDVVLPHYTQYVDCAEDYLTVAGTDRPSPEVTGYPFVITAFGYYDLGVDGAQTYCKLGATYEDKARVDICDQSFKFIREWTIYDWCNPGRTIIYNQLIKVGDFKGPEVGDLPQDPWDCLPTFSTGTYACESSFIIPTPDGLSDNCSDSITFSVDIIAFVPEYDVHGFLTGEYEQTNFRSGLRAGQLVTGVPKGLHLFKYTIGDECHNKTIVYFWFQVIDNSEPVAQCDDFLNVSIGAQTIDGSTRIYAKDVDEGSYDGCAEKVALATRRTFDDTACADQYSQLFFEVAFGSLVKRTNFDLYAFNPTLYGYYHVPVTVYFDTAPEGNPNALAVFTEETNPRGVTELFSILNDYVDILCCDIKDSVRIELWVWDDANMNGIPGDYDFLYGDDELFDFLQDRFCPTGEAEDRFPDIDCLPTCGQIWDNHNVCWLDVLIEDKAKPICKPPANITIPCTDTRVRYEDAFVCADSTLLNDFFGSFIGVDNCEVTVECIGVTDTRNNCGIGTITRNYRAVDGWGNASAICRQTITIFEEHNYVIGFPADTSGLCAQVKDTAIYIQENACDLLAIAVKDLRFEASGDECYKIERKFSVINWCEYDGISDPYVISRDVDGDGIGGDEDIWVIRRPSRTYLDRAGTAARNYIQNLPNINDASNAAGLLVAIETDRIPALNAEDTRTPFTDEFPDAPWGGNSPEGSWDWADAPVDLNKNGRIDTEIERGLGGTNDDASRGGTGANKLDKLYAYKQSVGFGNLTNFTTGYWQYTQFIKVYDNVDPTVTFDVDPFCSYSSDIAKGCPAPADIPFTVFEACTPNDIKIKVFLDAFDNGTIDADNLLPANTLKVKFGASVTGTYPNFVITGGLFPLGEHVFEVHILDGCGNSTVARIPFEVIDCKAPSPICINGLAVELMPVIPNADVDGDGDTDTGAMAIWANDFADVDKIIDCTGPVKLAIYRSDDEALTDSTFIPDPADIGITVTCGDFDSAPGNPNGAGGTVLVRVYAIDGAGNFDYCETYVLVQNNLNTACGVSEPGLIAGIVATEDNKPVKSVQVQMSGQRSGSIPTTVLGQYGFNNLELNYDYTITPELDENHINGVSTFDIVLITKHILGVQPLNSPYKLIAADINNSKSITTLDLIQIRRLILSIDTRFRNNTSWRFVDKKYVFPVPSNPWAEEFPEIININDLAGAINNADFVAVKMGDVNANVITNNLLGIEDRDFNGTFNFEVANEKLNVGDEVRVDFRASDLAKIQGYQATLTFDNKAVELMDIVYGVAKEENFGLTHVSEGVITTSWNGDNKQTDVLFTLVLKAKTDAEVANVLGISSRYTVAEGYSVSSDLMNVGIQFSNGTIAGAGFELAQNQPNPFKASTEIRFHLPTASDATMTISDMTGKVIKLVRGSYAKGSNKIDLNANDLPIGVLTYTLSTSQFSATKKMVVVK